MIYNVEQFKDRKKRVPAVIGTCMECNRSIFANEAIERVPAGKYHLDCYYVALGRFIDEQPSLVERSNSGQSNISSLDIELKWFGWAD